MWSPLFHRSQYLLATPLSHVHCVDRALGIDWLKNQVNEMKSSLSNAYFATLNKLGNFSQYVSRTAADFSTAFVQYAKPVLEKLFSGLEFFGSWAKKIGSGLIAGVKEVAGCLWTELDAHGTSGGSSVGLTMVAGLNLKLVPSLAFVCNRISCESQSTCTCIFP